MKSLSLLNTIKGQKSKRERIKEIAKILKATPYCNNVYEHFNTSEDMDSYFELKNLFQKCGKEKTHIADIFDAIANDTDVNSEDLGIYFLLCSICASIDDFYVELIRKEVK